MWKRTGYAFWPEVNIDAHPEGPSLAIIGDFVEAACFRFDDPSGFLHPDGMHVLDGQVAGREPEATDNAFRFNQNIRPAVTG